VSIKDITSEIENIAKKEIEKIENEAQKEMDKIKSEYEKILSEKKEDIKKRVEKKALELKNSIVTRKRLELKNKVLAKKQEILGKVLEEFKNEIKKLDDKKYAEFFIRILKENDIPKMDYVLIGAKNDNHVNEKFVSEISKALNLNVKLSGEKTDAEGGFILKADYMEMDFTLESIIKEIKSDKEPELVKILF
jgi:V/A-type H+-transporting ATPase subunit E